MRATLVISEEYKGNEPSVFIISDESKTYYGDLIYPHQRGFPRIDYWRTATSSDSDRGFKVKDVEYKMEDFCRIIDAHRCYVSCRGIMKRFPSWTQIPTYKIKRGVGYEAYLDEKFRRAKINAEIANHNEPFEKAARSAYRILIDLILNTYTES